MVELMVVKKVYSLVVQWVEQMDEMMVGK